MLNLILSWLEGFGLDPRLVVAVVIGLVVSWCFTQAAKEISRQCGRRLHGNVARLVAFLVGFSATITIATERGWLELWIALTVGVASPLAYKILQAVAGNRWEWVKHLSGDRND